MELKLFRGVLKDLVANLYDIANLETHPLAKLLELPAGFQGSRGEYLQQLVIGAIEKMRPQGRDLFPQAPEWRPYLILQRRYVEGIPPQVLAVQLSISDRQLRRDHSRALHALAERLFDQLFPYPSGGVRPFIAEEANLPGFEIQREHLDLKDVLTGVILTFQKRLHEENIDLQVQIPDIPAPVMADRVVLRQILISLFNYSFHLQSEQKIEVELLNQTGDYLIRLEFISDDDWALTEQDDREDPLEAARFWAAQLNAGIAVISPDAFPQGRVQLELSISRSKRDICLVVDDQAPTLRMFQRFLVRMNIEVIGVHDPAQVLELARTYLPRVISLDVMMPKVDGWEILQALQADPLTHSIPVIICSAWEEPELARSLGAAAFLKKPVTQKDFVTALETIGLLAD